MIPPKQGLIKANQIYLFMIHRDHMDHMDAFCQAKPTVKDRCGGKKLEMSGRRHDRSADLHYPTSPSLAVGRMQLQRSTPPPKID